MSAHTASTAAQEARRRRRKERAAASRTPEPKDIVSGAGQPLDPSVRRELEEQLGHDLSRVRLHTDRDAGTLTDLLGADAVAVGQDIFFGEGAYRPGTVDGQRLLAHELLHTIQNPDGLGTLRAGRDLGAVSLPQDGMEREAEGTAQALVRNQERGPETAPEIAPAPATPGWLRYATVDADRNRMEQIDPATLVDRLANAVVRSLRGDPQDRSKRTRLQLGRMSDELQDAVLERLETRLLTPEHERLLDLVDDVAYEGEPELSALDAPAVEPDPAAEWWYEEEREREHRSEAEERTDQQAEEERRQESPEPDPESSASPEAPPAPTPTPAPAPGQKGKAGADARRGTAQTGTNTPSGEGSEGAAPRSAASTSTSSGGADGDKTDGSKSASAEAQGQESAPAASKEESAAKNRTGAVEPAVADRQPKQEDRSGQEKVTGSPTTSGKDAELPGVRSTLDGARNQDIEAPEETPDEDPFGAGSESEVEVGGEEKSAWDVKLRPEDFLPAQDLDVSAVPTADTLDPSSSATPPMPTFPSPPPTKADQVHAERDAEDAEDAAAEAETEPQPAEDTPDLSTERDDSQGRLADEGPGPDLAAAPVPVPAPGSASKDPKSGADPKAGPVAAQMTVAEAPGGTSESGTGTTGATGAASVAGGAAPGGAESAGGQEKASPVAVGGTSAAPESGASQERRNTAPAAATRAAAPASEASAAPTTAPSPTPTSEPAPAAPTTSVSPPPPSSPEPVESPAPSTKARRTTAPAPTAKPPKGRGAGGAGGKGAKAAGAARAKKSTAAAPDLSAATPEAGLSTASKLKPHLAAEAMSGVDGAVDRTVDDEHKTLAASPPAMQRPSGAPQTLQGAPSTDAPAQYSEDPAQKSETPEGEDAEVTGAKEPEGEIEAEKAEEPGGWDTFKMALGFIGGKVVNAVTGFFGADEPVVDPQELAAKFAGLPTKDEALKQAQAGNAPGVEMQGAAGETSSEQGASVDAKGQETLTTGRDDAARDLGERQVYPDAPPERMAATVPGGKGGGGGAPKFGAPSGSVPPEALSEVAEHERGDEFQAAFTDGQKGMSDGRQTKDEDSRTSQEKHKQQVEKEIQANTRSQTNERDKALDEVTTERTEWREEQDEELKTLGTKKTDKQDQVREDVEKKEKDTDDDVGREKESGDKKIQDANTKAEEDAEKQRDDSVKESGNWVSKAFDWIKQKVIEIKEAIVRVIREARDAVIGFIKNFKETVEGWINAARTFIVDTIKNLINDLIEFAKSMVRAIVELANRIRTFITNLIQAAIALVQELANALKQIITDLLDAIGKMLSSILDFLKKMLQAVVDAVMSVVKQVLDFASQLLSSLGDWMMIAVDFLMDPGGWLSGAGSSAADGARNHLFREVSAAVKQWFQDKIQEIIGVPKATLDKLVKGGMKMSEIVEEAWNAVVPQLPLIIGELVITKVVAKLIPGAGWALAVIDAIRTAWGALSAILSALGMVLDWLKAVRLGGAGLLFAKAVAAGVVALLEVLYQALLTGIGKYVSKVGRRLKGVAARLGKGKGDKPGGGKGKGRESPDDKGESKKPPTDSAKKPGMDAKTQTATAPKPGQGRGGTSGKPKAQGDGKTPTPTTGKDNNGKAKNEEAKPTPKAEPPAKPRPEPTKGGDSAAPKTQDKKSAKPKDEGKDPHKPTNKDGGKDTLGKPKTDKDGDKPGRPKKNDDARQPKPKHETKGAQKLKRDRHEDRRPKDKDPEKENKKDQHKKSEDSKESKDERLRKIVARIRPRVDGMLRRGIGRPILRASLAAMRAWYRLTELRAGENERFQIEALLNPKETVANGLKMDTIELADAVDAMVAHVLQSNQVIAQSQRIGPPPGGPAAARTRVIPSDVGAAPMLRNVMDSPTEHRKPETFQVEAGDSQYNSRLTLERTEAGGGGTTLQREGSEDLPSYRQESRALREAEPNGALMGQHVLDALAGNRNLWQGNTVPNAQTLDQAVFTATLIGLIETGRTPFTMVPNIAAVSASKLGGPHIADLVTGLPLSGAAARFDRKDKVAKFGRDSYEVVGGQAAGRQTAWLLAARRESGRDSYMDTSTGVSVTEKIGKGFLKNPNVKQNGHPAPGIDELRKQFKGVPGWMIQKAYTLGGQGDMRVGPALWQKVGSEIKNKTALQPPSRASEEVLRRTAANLKLWADAKGLTYSPNDPQAKGEFLMEIYRDLVRIVGIPADSAFESRLKRGINV
ncbi:DUF4157 domain-containing protein [Streptomyces sp. NPDC096310]|uniref:eCIS core domain-containing protein n=1 Tax=Streptomyces sp. NPDC096310 TaxID=3366082 RepID=UPI003802A704